MRSQYLPTERFLRALAFVESRNDPKAIRFEPHLFIRHTGKQVPYTGPGPSHVRAETDRAAMDHAFQLDPVEAIRCSSFGLYQELGSALLRIEANPQRALDAFDKDPEGTSARLVADYFRLNGRALLAAQRLDFTSFARFYNGAGPNVANYAEALRHAYGLLAV